ncbi:MAG: DUF4230 domain-containing protein [Elusimicrobia bacterium]|nr:DUF4230 domain-containing protein [Elusimicrobiota bacterium]
MKLIKFLFIILLISCIFFLIFAVFKKNNISILEKNKKYDIKYFAWQIKNKGYLVSSELDYSGRMNYKINENAVWGTKWAVYREFIMIFDAKIEAGVDLTNVSLIETENKIIVKMPKATIKDIYIIPESIEYYDIKNTPIKWGESDKEAANNAKIKAKEDVKNNVNLDTLLKNAQSQAEMYIERFLRTGINKYIEFEIFDGNQNVEETSNIELIQTVN